MKIVITQSMYFPWVGLLEEIKLADILVHYNDVQLSRNSFVNRVEIYTEHGIRWMTLPLENFHRGQYIDEVLVSEKTDWRTRHCNQLTAAYRKAPYFNEMMKVVETVFSQKINNLGELTKTSIMALVDYFDLNKNLITYNSRDLGINGSSSQRVRDIVKCLNGDIYITGHGAKKYLDHNLFEESGIEVRYMDYQYISYPQIRGKFTPFVSALDLIANCGKKGASVISSQAIYWKDFINR
jgi:hypothetical protein